MTKFFNVLSKLESHVPKRSVAAVVVSVRCIWAVRAHGHYGKCVSKYTIIYDEDTHTHTHTVLYKYIVWPSGFTFQPVNTIQVMLRQIKLSNYSFRAHIYAFALTIRQSERITSIFGLLTPSPPPRFRPTSRRTLRTKYACMYADRMSGNIASGGGIIAVIVETVKWQHNNL